MRLRSRLSTTAALLSMCFCSVSNAASSLSTYWLVSCRHWPPTPCITHTQTRTQSPMNTHQDIGRQSQRNERGEENRKTQKKKVKRLKGGQRIGKIMPWIKHLWWTEGKRRNNLVLLAAISLVNDVIPSDSKRKWGDLNHVTDHRFFFLCGRPSISSTLQLCTHERKQGVKDTEQKIGWWREGRRDPNLCY